MNDFTFEEQQLMSIYNPGNRIGLIKALSEMRTYLDKDEQALMEQDDTFFFIAGYTSGGVPYGLAWEEMGLEPWEKME